MHPILTFSGFFSKNRARRRLPSHTLRPVPSSSWLFTSSLMNNFVPAKAMPSGYDGNVSYISLANAIGVGIGVDAAAAVAAAATDVQYIGRALSKAVQQLILLGYGTI
eukprot:scaffold3559_cov284-Chaetoceros_neogracile.AAC.21